MKLTIAFLVFFPSLLFGQPSMVSKNEPAALYHEIHDALAVGKTRHAIQVFDKVIEFYTDEHRESELPEGYFGLALAFALNGDYKESIRYHKKAIRAHKKFRNDSPAEIYANLGLTYRMAGKERMAGKMLKKSEF